MSKGYLAKCAHIKLDDLDPILKELEGAGKVKLAEVQGKFLVGLI